MLLTIPAVFILLYGFLNYKRSFMLFLAYQVFWYSGAQLLNLGKKSITVGLFFSLSYFILFLLKGGRLLHIKKAFPYTVPFSYVGFSLLLTSFFGVAGFLSEFTRAVTLIFQNLIFIWIMWQVLETKKDFQYLLKLLIVVFFVACIYGYIEYIMQVNPFVEYKQTLTNEPFRTYSSTLYRGYRMMSVFEHSIGAGMTMGLFSVFIFALNIRYKEKIPFKKFAVITAALCIPCVFLTKMRAGLVFLLISALSCIDLKKRKFYLYIIAIIGILIAAWPLLSQNLNVFMSLFSSSAKSEVGGSNIEMRWGQLGAVYNLMKMSPIAGLGEKFENFIVNQYTEAALDYESLWFEQMARHGLMGVAAYMVLIYYSIIKIPRKYKSKECFFFSLAYWFTYTATSVPSFRTYIYYMVIMYFIKNSDTYQNSVYIPEANIKLRGD